MAALFGLSIVGTVVFLVAYFLVAQFGVADVTQDADGSTTVDLTAAGGVASEFTVARLAEDAAYLTSAAAAEEMDHDLLRAYAAFHDVRLRNVTEEIGVIGLMGPPSRTDLALVCEADLTYGFPWLSFREITVADILPSARAHLLEVMTEDLPLTTGAASAQRVEA